MIKVFYKSYGNPLDCKIILIMYLTVSSRDCPGLPTPVSYSSLMKISVVVFSFPLKNTNNLLFLSSIIVLLLNRYFSFIAFTFHPLTANVIWALEIEFG